MVDMREPAAHVVAQCVAQLEEIQTRLQGLASVPAEYGKPETQGVYYVAVGHGEVRIALGWLRVWLWCWDEPGEKKE